MSDRIGIGVICTVCGIRKKPIGRSAPLEWHGCDDECPGYRLDPRPGSLWPGELKSAFGFECSDDGTAPVVEESSDE